MVAIENIGVRVVKGRMIGRRVGHFEQELSERNRKQICWEDKEKGRDEQATAKGRGRSST